ncbi:toxin-antitoxin system YwqK family antitoxin [Acetobacterium wieringae]|uniref:MORN repeat variant n=1 Tax=Acetobacterium wieringae TaxID=52694 RepID=A0A1F2PHG3_9FIRM|nr:toxin-antitoxin system YwqK family antitoxin [Acetobacterium wieringae]OFV70414.1 MORN repeat variant [Acetobacterium wieringae]TYC84044.1 toxin-antitoxin system YwqK family antitoxin [Acetobacterium wieringae]URN85927.1 toxin-antitoxin system YwqK family antitoxin [Acetobacterium wieringae]
MGGILFLFLVGIAGIILWLYLSSRQKKERQDQKPQVKVPCRDGYIIGYYQGNRLIGQRYVNNSLASTGVFVNTIQVGPGKEYYPNGLLKYEGNFVNGLASGQGKLYEENGKLKYIGSFANGYASGQGRIFDASGKLKCEGNFARLSTNQENIKDPSVPTGHCKEYYDNGQLKYEGEFLSGVWHGEGRSYDRSGRLVHKGKFRNGKAVG